MNGSRDCHIEWSKSEKGKYHDIAYIWSLKNDTNKPIYKTERLTDTENKLMVTKGNWEEEGSIGKLGLTYTHYSI